MLISPITSSYQSFSSRYVSRPNSKSNPSYDSFTGLKDKQTLLADINNKMYKKEDISLGMFDIDNFKSVNELLGYKTGDEFIKAVSGCVSKVAEKHGINAYRFGGDEFVVLLFNGSSKEEKIGILKEIMQEASNNPLIKDKEGIYRKNASALLSDYERQNQKVKEILRDNTRYSILQEIYSNTTIARQDPYIIQSLKLIKEKRLYNYESILDESIQKEENEKTKKVLKGYKYHIDEQQDNIDSYVLSRYDKNHEIYRIKGWLRDFEQNGFSLTSGIVDFRESFYRNKQSIDLINEVGEVLKKGKFYSKGSVLYEEFR